MGSVSDPSADGLARLANRIERLEAIEAIRTLVADYSFFSDHLQVGRVVELFSDDCVVDYGVAPRVSGRVELQAMLLASAASEVAMVSTSHHNADVRVELIDRHHAHGTVSLYAWHVRADGGRAEVWGYYFDEYVRGDGGWLISKRSLRLCGEDGFPARWTLIERQVPT